MKIPVLDCLFAFLAGIVAFDFIRTPFTNDVTIFQGVAYIADRYYPFPYGIDLAWEAKPIGNRIINYVILKLTEITVPFEHSIEFAVVAKMSMLAVIIIVAWYFASAVDGKHTFWIVFFAFTTCLNFCIMQAEYHAVLLSLVCIIFVVSNNQYLHYLAGSIIFFIATIKGITLFLFVPILCGAYLLGKSQQTATVKVLAGFCAAGAVAVILQLTVWKNMIPDLLLAPLITGVGRWPVTNVIVAFMVQSFMSLYYIPVLPIGMLGVILLFASGKLLPSEKVAFALMWITPISMILIHSENFAYQFFICVLPAVVTIVYCSRILDGSKFTHGPKSRIVPAIMPVAISWMIFAWVVLNLLSGVMLTAEQSVYMVQQNNSAEIDRLYNISSQHSVLYLDAGAAPYYFRANSTSRYICPLPLQRSSPEWELRGNDAVERVYADIVNYDGEYIVADGNADWFHMNYTDRGEIREKLNTEYQLVWNNSWRVYRHI